MTQRTDDQMGGHMLNLADAIVLERALAFVAEFQGDPRCALNCMHAESLAAEVHHLRELVTTADAARQRAEKALRGRRACDCSEPDPVMQADGKFYCYRCSFQTGARPHLDLEDALRRVKAAEEARAQLESYVQHKAGCRAPWPMMAGHKYHCECGLAALVQARPPEKE